MTHLFDLTDIGYAYGNTRVLSGVTCSIAQHDLTIITGMNGIGKTTLLNILAGIIEPTSGTIQRKKGQKMAYIGQDGVDHAMTLPISVTEFVHSGSGRHRPKHDHCGYTTLSACLEHVGLLEQRDSPIDQLSGGQQQRALIARALMTDPSILLLDEPTAGIDTSMQSQFYELIQHFNTVHGLTTIMITHDADRQYTFGDHVIHLTRTQTDSDIASLRARFSQKKITIITLP